MKNRMDGGEAVLEALRRLGVDFIISSPGSEWPPVWEALVRQQLEGLKGPRYLDCGHEVLAVGIATGYTQVTGRMQAVLLHAGAGLLQGSIAVHGAEVTEVPMLVMSGEALSYGEDPDFDPGAQWYRNLSVVGGPHRLVEPIVKWASQVTSPHTLYQSVVRAGEMAQRNPKGPTYLNVPVETMLKEWAKPGEARPVPSAPTMRPAQEDIDRVAELLVAARCPVIMAESAGRDPAAFHALVELAEVLAIPVVEARASGYANFPKDHPLYLGSDETSFLGETDLVLAVANRAPWYPPDNRPRNATVVAISDNPLKGHMAYQNLGADLYLEGDVATSIELLIEAVRSSGVTTDAYADRARRWASEHEAMLARQRTREAAADHKSKPIDPLVLLAAMRERLPGDVIYVDETVVHSAALHAHLSWSGPQSYFRVPTGLGQGLGVALGVKMASPKRPVVLLIGDGTFMYNPVIAALNFARGNDLPILVVVFNNGKYQAMKKNHLGYYPDGLSATSQIFHGVTLDGPDYADLAAMFGGYGRKVDDPAQIGPALTEAMAALSDGKVAILNVVLSA